MADTIWLTVAASVLGGGAAGAVITAVVSAVRSRKQAIAYRSEILPVFNGGMFADSEIVATLTLSSLLQGGYAQNIPNLSVANIEIINHGNKDYPEFKLGFSLSEGDAALHCVANALDRHHQVRFQTKLGPATPTTELDFVLAPFNRQDQYSFTLYVVAQEGRANPDEIKLGSPEPVIFTQVPTITQRLIEASKVAIELGPFKLMLR